MCLCARAYVRVCVMGGAQRVHPCHATEPTPSASASTSTGAHHELVPAPAAMLLHLQATQHPEGAPPECCAACT